MLSCRCRTPSSWSTRQQRDRAGRRTWGSWRTGWRGPSEAGRSGPCPLATADQQDAGREFDVPLLQGNGLTDTQPRAPHDERHHPGAAKPQSRQGVQEPLDPLMVPLIRNVHWKLLPQKFPYGQSEPAHRAIVQSWGQGAGVGRHAGNGNFLTRSSFEPSSRALREIQPDGAEYPLSEVYGLQPAKERRRLCAFEGVLQLDTKFAEVSHVPRDHRESVHDGRRGDHGVLGDSV